MSDSSEITPNLSLPVLLPSQAQKHVTHNAALERLDLLTQLTVRSASLPAPPPGAEDGDRYIVGAGAGGPWTGQERRIAALVRGAWLFLDPQEGWIAHVAETGLPLVFGGIDWQPLETALPDQVPALGIGAAPDPVNKLSVAADGVALSHAGSDHRLTLNKAGVTDTASLVFQSGWSGRAEFGLAGEDAFSLKVSEDGQTFRPALTVDPATARVRFEAGADGLTTGDFGTSPLATTGYVASRGVDLVTNGGGHLGNGYNAPPEFAFDPAVTPNLPGGFSYAGHYPGLAVMEERIAIDPNAVYRLSSYLLQEALPGDYSAFPKAERHMQYMGLLAYDVDGHTIQARHHMRYRHGGTDSLTTLSAPLAPGDTVIQLTSAAGWNEDATQSFNRGVILFGDRSSLGAPYSHYSRLVEFDLFALGAVDKTAQTVTLSVPFPASLANPDAGDGVWPAGTPIANSSNGAGYKYSFYSALVPPAPGQWFRTTSHMGGIDLSGQNVGHNFPPGTASVAIFWLPNYSNRIGGYQTYPDTGPAHRFHVGGISVRPDDQARLVPDPDLALSGSSLIEVPTADPVTGALALAPAQLRTEPV